jgi:hypothetical protein
VLEPATKPDFRTLHESSHQSPLELVELLPESLLHELPESDETDPESKAPPQWEPETSVAGSAAIPCIAPTAATASTTCRLPSSSVGVPEGDWIVSETPAAPDAYIQVSSLDRDREWTPVPAPDAFGPFDRTTQTISRINPVSTAKDPAARINAMISMSIVPPR